MNNILERSLIDALSYCAVRKLPDEQDENRIWIKSICLVSKYDGTKSYVAAIRGKEGKAKVIKDFGTVSSIAVIDKIYPYIYLDESFLPTFKHKKLKQERIDWLNANSEENKNFDEMSSRELFEEIINVSITKQIKSYGR